MKRTIKFRHILIAVGCIGVLVAIPLFEVWKQAYLAETSLKHETMKKQVSALTTRHERLKIAVQHYGSRERIEKIAGTYCEMRYPSSGRISVVPKLRDAKKALARVPRRENQIIAIIKNSLKDQS